MNTRQKVIGALLVLLLLFIIGGRDALGREVQIRGAGGAVQTWDLTKMGQRVEFRALYGAQIPACIERGDYAVRMMKERDSGTPESAHLAEVKANYEATKAQPEGAVGWHVYVDFQRMVRDLHRTDGSGYVWKTEGVVWEREVWWCVFPGSTRY